MYRMIRKRCATNSIWKRLNKSPVSCSDSSKTSNDDRLSSSRNDFSSEFAITSLCGTPSDVDELNILCSPVNSSRRFVVVVRRQQNVEYE